MKKADKILKSLLKSARQAPPATIAEPRFGFSTRVVAEWQSARETSTFADIFQFLSLRAFSVAVCIAFVSLAFYMQAGGVELSMTQNPWMDSSLLAWELFQ
jgi:hypothetical protein